MNRMILRIVQVELFSTLFYLNYSQNGPDHIDAVSTVPYRGCAARFYDVIWFKMLRNGQVVVPLL